MWRGRHARWGVGILPAQLARAGRSRASGRDARATSAFPHSCHSHRNNRTLAISGRVAYDGENLRASYIIMNWDTLDVPLGFGFCVGLYYFYRGLRVFREYRVLRDTPETPIRSIAMGLVEIHGKATGIPPIPSPVTKSPCYFYVVDIDHWVETKQGGDWEHVATDADGPRFYLDDDTGRVLVDAHHAEYDLPWTVAWEARYKPGTKAKNHPWGTSPSPGEAPDLWTYAASVISRKKGHGFTVEKTDERARYRLTERLIVPEHRYDITGTCAENPDSKDVHDRNLIMKGTNEPTFLITSRSDREIKQVLRDSAKNYVFRGGIAAVICLGLILLIRGWL